MARSISVAVATVVLLVSSLWMVNVATSADSPQGGPATAAPRKLALLVGIGKYERQVQPMQPPDWWNLSSHADIEAMKKVLQSRFNFQPTDIVVLEDAAATRDGIIKAFEDHLIRQAKPGDMVYVHYSGHGQQVADDNGDEFDGLDETLVTANYISQKAEDGATTNLRDDKLGELLQKLQAKMVDKGKLRGSITVTLDSCFSGSGTRGDPNEGRLTRRGRGWNIDVDGPLPPRGGGGVADEGSGLLSPGEAVKQEYVLITASSFDEVANEWTSEDGGKMGALTNFLVRELENATSKTTYRAIFEKVNAEITSRIRRQNPTLEGNSDSLLFLGTAVPREQYVVVSAVDGDTLTLPAGAVHGLVEDSVFQIYPPGSSVKDPKQRIAEAVVTEVTGATSKALLTEPYRGRLKVEELRAAHAVENERAYGDNTLKLWVDGPLPAAIAAEISTLKMVSTEGVTARNFDLRVGKPKVPSATSELVLEQTSQVVLQFNPATSDAGASLREAIQNEYRSRFLLKLQNPDTDPIVNVDIRIVPVTVELDLAKKKIVKVARKEGVREDETGRTSVQLTDGDFVTLEVRNRSERVPVYISIIHFPPDRAVYCLFPDREDNSFPPDGKWTSLGKKFVFQAEAQRDAGGKIVPTPAVETFKAIATLEPSNYRDLLPSSSPVDRGPGHVRGGVQAHPSRPRVQKATAYDLGRLLGTAVIGEDPDPGNPHTRSRTVSVVVTDWNTASVKAETRPKK